MPNINFDIFDKLWTKVEQQFKAENDKNFTLDNLAIALDEEDLPLRPLDFTNIEQKYLKKRNDTPLPQTFKGSNTTLKYLLQYAKVESLDKLIENIDDVIEELERENDRTWRFLGRKEELRKMNDFLQDDTKRILEISGVPMIGKTALVNHFLDKNHKAKQYDVREVKLTTSENVEKTLFMTHFLNDFESYKKPTIIIIENFEEALEWTSVEISEEDGEEVQLHDIKKAYKGGSLKAFIEKIAESQHLKLILETRFLINFPEFLDYEKVKQKTKRLPLSGLPTSEFWNLYKKFDISKEDFEKICHNLNNHTGLLAFVFKNDFYYSELYQAIQRPQHALRKLWKLVSKLINRLNETEIYTLCFLSAIETPITFRKLFDALQELPQLAKKDEDTMQMVLMSLEKKLFVQPPQRQAMYEINPFLREVCYVNFQKGYNKKYADAVKALPFLKQYGKTRQYNKSQQLFLQGEFIELLRLGIRNRKEKKYAEAHEAFNLGLQINPKKEVVYNEIGLTFKFEKKYDKAIEVLQKAVALGNIHSYNELAICYKEQGKFDKAIEVLQKATKDFPNNERLLNELAICYKEQGKFDKAIE
ncbi:MAG: tetratricopeptide repeat protein, partial [Chitinophagales bacterium]